MRAYWTYTPRLYLLVGCFLTATALAPRSASGESTKFPSMVGKIEGEVSGSKIGVDAEQVEQEETDLVDSEQVGIPEVQPVSTGGRLPTIAELDKGPFKLYVTYGKPTDAEQSGISSALKGSRLFEELSAGLSESLILPRNVEVSIESCGVVNAFYDPETYKISMCLELFQAFMTAFSKDTELSQEEIGQKMIYAAIFTFLHELGHSLVHVFDIPITGREEDAVDDFAAVFSIAMGDEGERIIFTAIENFYSDAEAVTSLDDIAFWDEHSLDLQRLFNQACIIYGSNPEKYSSLVGDDSLPEARAERCPSEYEQKAKSWGILLASHIR